MEGGTASKITVEQLKNNSLFDNLLSLLDVGAIIHMITGLFILISLIIVFFSLIKIYKIKNIIALKYLYIAIGIYLFTIIIQILLTIITSVVPELFDVHEGNILDFSNVMNYIGSIIGTLFIFWGAIKLREYAKAL